MGKMLRERTKKRIETLKNQYAIAYSTKEKDADANIMKMYYESMDEMKKDIITNDPIFLKNKINETEDIQQNNVEAKLRIYKAHETMLYAHSDKVIKEKLENTETKRRDPGFFFALQAEQTIRNYFREVSGTSFGNFEEQCVKLTHNLAERLHGELKQSSDSKEPTNFDPKKETRTMYKQLNKLVQKDELKEKIKGQLSKYFIDQSKKQQSFYDVSASKTFRKWNISNMADTFKENPEKIEVNLETIKTKVLEDRKKELKKELKKEKKIFKNFKDSLPSNSISASAIGPGKRENLKELTFLNEELRVREQLKKAEKHFGIKLNKIFGEETVQVEKEFRNLLCSDDSLVKAVKVVQQTFSDKNEPKKNVTLSEEQLQANVNGKISQSGSKVVQRGSLTIKLDENTGNLMHDAQSLAANVKKASRSQPSKFKKGINAIWELRVFAPLKKSASVKIEVPEKLQAPVATVSGEVDQRRRGFIITPKERIECKTPEAKSLAAAVKEATQSQPSNLRSILERMPGFQRITPIKQARIVGEQNQTYIPLRGFDQQRKASIKRSSILNSNLQNKQNSTVIRDSL